MWRQDIFAVDEIISRDSSGNGNLLWRSISQLTSEISKTMIS